MTATGLNIYAYKGADVDIEITVKDQNGDAYELTGTNKLRIYTRFEADSFLDVDLTWATPKYTGTLTAAQTALLRAIEYPMEWMVNNSGTYSFPVKGTLFMEDVYVSHDETETDEVTVNTVSLEVTVDTRVLISVGAALSTEPADTDYFAIFTTTWLQFTWLSLKTWLANIFLKLDQSAEQTFSGGVPKLAADRTITDIHHLVDLKLLNESVGALGARYYMTSAVCGDTSYYLTAAEAPSAFSIDFANVLTGVVAQWISPTGSTPSKLIKGQYEWDIFAARTAGNKSITVYWELVKITSLGVETILATSATSDAIVAKRRVLIPLTLADDVTFDSTNRVVGKIYATVGGGAATTLTLYGGGTDNSHWEIPTNLEILSTTFAGVHNPIEITTDITINAANIATYQGATLTSTAATPISITIAEGAGVTEPIELIQGGAGIASFVAGGATVITGDLSTTGVNTMVRLIQEGVNTFRSVRVNEKVTALTASYADVAVGDRLQDIGEKVLGLQDYLLDFTTTSLAGSINITQDRYGNPLSIPVGRAMELLIYVTEFKNAITGVAFDSRASIRINGVEATASYFTLNTNGTTYSPGASNSPNQHAKINIYNFGRVFIFSEHGSTTILAAQVYRGWTTFNVTSITSITILEQLSGGTNHLGIGTRVILRML